MFTQNKQELICFCFRVKVHVLKYFLKKSSIEKEDQYYHKPENKSKVEALKKDVKEYISKKSSFTSILSENKNNDNE